jgi:hypothetical protein
MRLRIACIALTALATSLAAAGGTAAAAGRSSTPCHSTVSLGLLPAWARSGFSDPRPRMRYAVGNSGAIAALVFGYPLQSPPDAKRNNKILWVVHRQFAFGDLHILAQRMRGTTRIGKSVAQSVPGGPGPSIIDLPAPGCWRMTLTWTHGRDTLDLRYS